MRGFYGQEFLMCSFIKSQGPSYEIRKKQLDVLSRMINSFCTTSVKTSGVCAQAPVTV